MESSQKLSRQRADHAEEHGRAFNTGSGLKLQPLLPAR